MSRYEARRKFGEHGRGVRVARVAANSTNDNKNYKKVELTNFQICHNHASQRQNGHDLRHGGSCNLSISSTFN